jgi:Acetoacetate decarboxylase (ADC)
MPLAGCMDIARLLDDAPTVELGATAVRVEGVEILQVLFEVPASDAESLVPAALNPTIPPVVTFLAYRAAESSFGPFSLVQTRVIARAAVRPRAFLVSACCDNEEFAAVLAGSFGFRTWPGKVRFHRFHDRVESAVTRGRATVLHLSLIDPEPITGHDVKYAPGMHLALVSRDGATSPRLVQVDTEYEFHRADRGRPVLHTFDARAWGDERLVPTVPISASVTTCDVTIMPVRYLCNPDIPAAEGTELVGGQ